MTIAVRSLCLAGLFGAFAWVASAAQVEGVLIDKMCSAKFVKGGPTAAMAHQRSCALADACQKSGYGVITAENKYLTFDAAGNEKALAALKASTKENGLKVMVEGDIKGSTIKVASLKLEE